MADGDSIVSGVIEQIQPGGSSGTKHSVASTAYGYCVTAANTAIKNVNMTGFKLLTGVTVHIKFQYANTASNPKLKFNGEADTNAKPIVQYGTTAASTTDETSGWYAGAVLTLTYDGTSWVRDQGFNTNSTYSAMSVAEARTGTATSGRSIRADYLKTFLSTLGGSGLDFVHTSEKIELNHSNSVTAKTAYVDTATTASANSGTIKVTDIKYDTEGHITGSQDRTITLSQKTNFDDTYLKLNGSNNMTADVNIIAGDTDKFINFWYNTNKTAGASWRAGMLGSGSGNTNYFVIQSGTSTTSATTWNNALKIGQNNYDIYNNENRIPNTGNATGSVGGTTTPVYVDAGVIKAGTALKDLAYIAKPTSNTTTTFLRGDGTWQTALTSHQSLAAYAPLASPALTGTPTAPTAADGTNTTQIATTAFVMSQFKYNDAMIYKGVVNSNNDLPTTHYQGWTYKVATAGTYAGIVCEIGDMIICNTDGTSANNAHWNVIQTNIDGAVIGPAAVSSGRDNSIARFNGETGKIIQDSLVTIDDNGHMSFGTEKVINFRMNRKKADGGGWACSYINWYDNANTLFANLGAFGQNNNFDYLYLGAEAYNSTKNLKILPSGRVRVLSLDFNGTGSYGGETQPIYWKDGVPVACTSYANASVNYATSAGTANAVAWGNVSGKPIEFITHAGALNTNGWKTMGARTSGAKIAIAYNNNPASWNSQTYSSSLVFGCNDTKGLLDLGYNLPIVTFGGSANSNGNDNDPYWYFKLSGTSGQTYTFPSTSKTLAASDGSNASGSWGISITGSAGSVAWANTGHPDTFPPSAHAHYELATIGDKRGENTTPNTYANRLIFQGLKTNTQINSPYTDVYSYLIGLRGWSNSSGGNSHELAFNGNGIYRRQGATTTWGNWFHILDSNNTSAANANGTAVSVTCGTDATLATINDVAVKINVTKPTYTYSDVGAAPSSTVSCTTANVKSALGTGSGTTKFLREDGTWQTPAYTTNTDEKLKIAAVTSGTTYYPIVAANSTAAANRQYDATGFAYLGTNGTTSAVGVAKITLGNSTASGTANNKQGSIGLYGSTAYLTTIVSGAPTAANTLTLPTATGTIALTSDIPNCYGKVTVSAQSSAVTALTSQSSATTPAAKSANETLKFTTANKWIVATGTESSTAGSDEIKIAHLVPSSISNTGPSSAQTPGYNATFNIPVISVDEAGHVTGISTTTVKIPASDNTNTASAVDNILDGSNSGTAITYAPYSGQQTKLSFDVSTTDPTRTDRLNLNGNFHATNLYGDTAVIDNAVTLKYNTTDSALEFVFG